jgi:hypothetical protein
MADTAHSSVAKRLARLVVEGGRSHRFRKSARPGETSRRPFRRGPQSLLQAFHTAVVRELAKDTLTIESAQDLPEEVLQQVISGFQHEGGRSLNIIKKINPELIAGLRVRLGDTVYDASLSSNLHRLSSRIR